MFPEMFSEDSGPEAWKWLRTNQNRSALASNRFSSTEEALEFVDKLYAMGAKRVLVPKDSIQNDSKTIQHQRGPYADALIVELDPEADPSELIQVCAEEFEGDNEDFPGEPIDGKWLYFWWD
jgi:hypothetical protein